VCAFEFIVFVIYSDNKVLSSVKNYNLVFLFFLCSCCSLFGLFNIIILMFSRRLCVFFFIVFLSFAFI